MQEPSGGAGRNFTFFIPQNIRTCLAKQNLLGSYNASYGILFFKSIFN